MSLFRHEVVEARRRRLWGDVRLSQPPSLTVWTLVLSALIVWMLAALVWGRYAKKETVAGYVAPEAGIVQVSASRAGRVVRIHAREGDHVDGDAALIELSGETVGAYTGQMLEAQLKQIDQQIKISHARRTANEAGLQSDDRRLRDQLKLNAARLALVDERIRHQIDTIALMHAQSAKLATLAEDGYVTRLQLDDQQQRLLAQKSEINGLQGEAASIKASTLEMLSELNAISTRRIAATAESDLDLSLLQQKRIELSTSQRFVERAPVGGVISSLQAQVGLVPPSNAPLLSIMPDDSVLLAELLVPTRAAGFMEVGDEVRMQVEAYPFERFGFVLGRVTSISRSILKPGEFLAPIEIKEAVYRVRVALERDYVIAYGKHAMLRPGMVLRADVIIDRKPLWRLLLDPLLAAARRLS